MDENEPEEQLAPQPASSMESAGRARESSSRQPDPHRLRVLYWMLAGSVVGLVLPWWLLEVKTREGSVYIDSHGRVFEMIGFHVPRGPIFEVNWYPTGGTLYISTDGTLREMEWRAWRYGAGLELLGLGLGIGVSWWLAGGWKAGFRIRGSTARPHNPS